MQGYTDQAKTWELARKLEAGADDNWLSYKRTGMSEHLEAYRLHLKARNASRGFVADTCQRIQRALDGCGFKVFRQVRLSVLEGWLASQRTEGIFGIKTSNYFARDFKSFCSWLVDSGRAEANPIAKFSPLNAEPDGKRERRTLTDKEFDDLVAANTGFRVSELASLKPEDCDLDGSVIQVKAAHSKRRRTDRQPIRLDLVELLRSWLVGRTGLLWPGPWKNNAAGMLKCDLAAAGIPYQDQAGRYFDFHALRGQFISALARSGVSPKAAQELARHSTIVLTMDTFAKVHAGDKAAALNGLPPLSIGRNWTPNWTPSCVPEGQNVAQGVTSENYAPTAAPAHKSFDDRYLSPPVTTCYGLSKEALVGVEPTMADLQSHSNTLAYQENSTFPRLMDTKMDTSFSALAKVVEAWPKLPEVIQRAILALVGCSTP